LCTVPELPVPITDPQRIRALSHPLRLELLDVLGDAGAATATRCAELTGESVASCSFHLRMLAKYGYIEPAERSGREKPWRLASRSRTLRPDLTDPASVRAVEAVAGLFVEHEVERIRHALAMWPSEPPEWMDAVTVSGAGFWATAEELTEFSETLQHLTDRFAGRSEDPSQRPAGARPIRLFAVATVDVDQEARGS
jgi:DNA-binding transcriptional ArsR family regulator